MFERHKVPIYKHNIVIYALVGYSNIVVALPLFASLVILLVSAQWVTCERRRRKYLSVPGCNFDLGPAGLLLLLLPSSGHRWVRLPDGSEGVAVRGLRANWHCQSRRVSSGEWARLGTRRDPISFRVPSQRERGIVAQFSFCHFSVFQAAIKIFTGRRHEKRELQRRQSSVR